MALDYARPAESLAIELREVARDANALLDVLNRGFNFPLPSEFPKDQLIDICKSLIQLPEGTAEGCRAPLDYARHRLPSIRREYIQSEELSARAESAPALTRGENLDLRLGTLISSVTTALDEYRRLAADEAVAESKPEASVAPIEGAIADAALEASSLDSNIANAQANVDVVARSDSKPADDLKRQLRDARGLNRLAFAEIRMPRVVVSWLRKSVDALKEYPDLIRQTANGLRIGTDIVGIGIERWHEIERDLGRFVVDQMHRTWDAFDKIADVLETRRRKGSVTTKLPEDFDLDAARILILEGKSPPKAWWPFIAELNFEDEESLHDLAPLASLTNLQTLNLEKTHVSDVTALARLTNLQSLNLRGTRVTDVAALADLTNLQNLRLWDTQVSDVAPLASLTNLRSLDLWGTHVSDVSPLAALTNLQSLDLWGTQVRDVAALAGLTSLKSLDLRGTQVSNLAALTRLTNLEMLRLNRTRLSDVTSLAGLTNLRTLELWGTQVRDVAALASLTNLRSFDLRGTQVSDITALAGLTNLVALGLRSTQVSDLAALARLTNLRSLDLAGTQVKGLTALTRLTNLESLDLSGTQVGDLAALAGLTNLRSLDLSGTQVSDVAALAGLTDLEGLNLERTRVTDVTALRHIQGLRIHRGRRKRISKRSKERSRSVKRAR